MNVRYIGEDRDLLKKGNIYEVIAIENGWFRIRTESDREEVLPPEQLETLMRNWNFDADEIFY